VGAFPVWGRVPNLNKGATARWVQMRGHDFERRTSMGANLSSFALETACFLGRFEERKLR
jgi:hypothetical protein